MGIVYFEVKKMVYFSGIILHYSSQKALSKKKARNPKLFRNSIVNPPSHKFESFG
jgi:hypothetical protein